MKVLDRLDRYQTVAAANQVYDEEARAKLLAKINRVAANLGIDEVMYAAGREHSEEDRRDPGKAGWRIRARDWRPARATVRRRRRRSTRSRAREGFSRATSEAS